MNGIQFDLAALINALIAVLIGGFIGVLVAGSLGRRLYRRSIVEVTQLIADAEIHSANAETYFQTTVRFVESFAKELLTDLGVLEDIGFDWETDENGRIVNAKIDLKVRPRQAAQSGQRVAPASNG